MMRGGSHDESLRHYNHHYTQDSLFSSECAQLLVSITSCLTIRAHIYISRVLNGAEKVKNDLYLWVS